MKIVGTQRCADRCATIVMVEVDDHTAGLYRGPAAIVRDLAAAVRTALRDMPDDRGRTLEHVRR